GDAVQIVDEGHRRSSQRSRTDIIVLDQVAVRVGAGELNVVLPVARDHVGRAAGLANLVAVGANELHPVAVIGNPGVRVGDADVVAVQLIVGDGANENAIKQVAADGVIAQGVVGRAEQNAPPAVGLRARGRNHAAFPERADPVIVQDVAAGDLYGHTVAAQVV